jgi:hypothetical protein
VAVPGSRDIALPVLIALLGFFVLFVEGVSLLVLYLVLRPESASWLNVTIGTLGLLSMIAMLIYSVARRSKALRDVMRLSYWLQLHIFLGLQGILLSVVHCLPILWRHGWPILVNPGMLNLYAVMTVFASGLFGRYLYAQVPKTVGGQHLEAKGLEAELAALGPVPPELAALWVGAPGAGSFFGVIRAGFARMRALFRLRQMKLEPKVRALARRRVLLEHQKAAMLAAQRVFRYWIVLHRPIAVGMYFLTAVHVLVALVFTSDWPIW